MSTRYNVPAKQPGMTVGYGWDRPMSTFFAIVSLDETPEPEDDEDEADSVVLWLRGKFHEHQTAGELVAPLAPYFDLTDAILAQLAADREAAPPGI